MLNIMIIRPGALGDTLMLMPSLIQLTKTAQTTVVGRSPGIEFLMPYVHRCIDFERAGWHELFVEKPVRIPSMNSADDVIAFMGHHADILKKNLESALPDASVHIFPGLPSGDENMHTAFYLAQCLEDIGLPLDAKKAMDDACSGPVLQWPATLKGKQKIVLHPGSGSEKKNYDHAFWLPFIERIRHRFSKDGIILLLGPAEERLYPIYVDLLKGTDIEILFSPEKEKLSSLLTQAPLYIGHDSGITHLAAMLGRPTIALFKDSSSAQWRPLGPMVRVFECLDSKSHLLDKVLNSFSEFIEMSL